MNNTRRKLLIGAGAAGAFTIATAAGLTQAGIAHASSSTVNDFGVNDFETMLHDLGGVNAQSSNGINITVPDIAEQGAIVPIEIYSQIPDSESIAILVEKNAIPVVAKFEFKNGGVARVATRIKLAESSPVHVVVRAAGKHYRATKFVKAVIGGCGDEDFGSAMKSNSKT